MPVTVVRYKAKVGSADVNQALAEAVYAELAATAPKGLRYATLRLDDGVTFIHIASIDTDDGSNPLTQIAAFNAFGAEIADRCDEPPVAMRATVVGSFGFPPQ